MERTEFKSSEQSRKVRQPGGIRGVGAEPKDSDEEESNLALGPMQQLMTQIVKKQKGIKGSTPSSTPTVPASVRKRKLQFHSSSPAKTPKTPSDQKEIRELPFSGTAGDSPWQTPAERAKASVKRITRQSRKTFGKKLQEEAIKEAKKGILKTLEQAPGWKPFVTPTKRKLDDKDW